MEIIPVYLVYFGLILIGVELIIGVDTGFDLVLLGIAVILGGGFFWLSNNLWIGVGTTTIITFSYLFFGRKLLKSKLFFSHHKTNTDQLIGSQGLVTKKIIPHHPGQIKVNGEVWRAQALKTINENETVIVKNIDGVTLKVEKGAKK
jgi:membrane protein implicated in regulation of membrane protease activity